MMKTFIRSLATAFLCTMVISRTVAQSLDNPGGYMDYIAKAEEELAKKYLSYMSASSHGSSMKKVDKRRTDLLNSIYETRVQITDMPAYKGDKTLKDASVDYLKILYSVFNEDYAKIVDMQEIAEQSYDAMEAYILVQDKANEKLKTAYQSRAAIGKDFAKKYNVTLVETGSPVAEKLAQAEAVGDYYHQVYLIFFKAFNQEKYLIQAIDQKNVNSIEQNKNALAKYSEEGLEKLKSIKSFDGDGSIVINCRQMLEFLKDEANSKVPTLTDFFLKAENFAEAKKAFDAKPSSKRTQKDVDDYNKAVNDMNNGVNKFNNTNNTLNTNRHKLLTAWNDGVNQFMDTHMPYK